MICNGRYESEETAAHASDTLARKLMTNGEQGHKLNFPNDDTEVFPEVTQSCKPTEKLPHFFELHKIDSFDV